jgi:VIT1/CCC1 family predicted Fe2+/Mn2+ transporter
MPAAEVRRPVLDPLERTMEVLFGLIMVLTFTLSLEVASAERADVREMLIGAIGCNLAWGLVDGVMYLMATLVERARKLALHRRLRAARDEQELAAILGDEIPPLLASVLGPEGPGRLRAAIAGLPEPAPRVRLGRDDWSGAAAVFLFVFLSTLPVVLPFLLIAEPYTAMRVSNAVAVTMLFACGWQLGRYTNGRPLRFGLALVLLGVVLVAVTMALGG